MKDGVVVRTVKIDPEITLRDYLAGQATEEDIEFWSSATRWNDTTITREQARYRFADAMIKAKKGGGDHDH